MMNPNQLLLALLVWTAALPSTYAQCKKVDSLVQSYNILVAQRAPDTTQINILNQIAREYLQLKQEGSAWNYAQRAYQRAQSANYEDGCAEALLSIGGAFATDPLKREQETEARYLEAFKILEKLNKPAKTAYAAKVIADYYDQFFYLGDDHTTQARNFYERYLRETEKTGNILATAKAYATLGDYYAKLGENSKSKEAYAKAVDLHAKLGDDATEDQHIFAEAKRSYDAQIQNERTLNYGLGIGVMLLLFVVILLFVNINQRRKSHRILATQKQEIERQNKDLAEKTQQLEQQKEEIQQQNDQLETQNHQLLLARQEIEEQKTKLEDLVEHLEEKVSERTRDLRHANQALAASNKELDTLIYRASHDFKGPVATLTGLAQVARLSCEPDSPAQEFLDRIEFTAQKMDGMLEKLHQVSFLLAKPLSYEVIDFVAITEEVFANLVTKIPSIPPVLRMDIDEHLRYISDTEIVQYIFENVLENAIQYRNTKSDAPSDIHIQITSNDKHISVVVEDNGGGIPEQFLGRVFDMFFRGSELATGNGLGLYVVRKAVERLDGTAEIESVEGSFTRISILLPK